MSVICGSLLYVLTTVVVSVVAVVVLVFVNVVVVAVVAAAAAFATAESVAACVVKIVVQKPSIVICISSEGFIFTQVTSVSVFVLTNRLVLSLATSCFALNCSRTLYLCVIVLFFKPPKKTVTVL